mmetsp:Transcript_10832/g.24681  ORF Transcript_10832/g.24681 Transcript_10832/m.24681 type:complete len:218 (-) Transcript_10832:685-1338(-)
MSSKALASASSWLCNSCANLSFSASSARCLSNSSNNLASASSSSLGIGASPQGKLAHGASSRNKGERCRSSTVTKRMRAEYVLLIPLVYMLTRNCNRPAQAPSSSARASRGSSAPAGNGLGGALLIELTASKMSMKPAVASSSCRRAGNSQPKLSSTFLPSAKRSRIVTGLWHSSPSSETAAATTTFSNGDCCPSWTPSTGDGPREDFSCSGSGFAS